MDENQSRYLVVQSYSPDAVVPTLETCDNLAYCSRRHTLCGQQYLSVWK